MYIKTQGTSTGPKKIYNTIDYQILAALYNSISIAALSGNYVNFGVFELYGDRALADALDIALKMILSIPFADVLAFPKV